MKSWWDGLPERCMRMGLGPIAANALREDFARHCDRFRAEISALPPDWQAAAWECFERVFLTAP